MSNMIKKIIATKRLHRSNDDEAIDQTKLQILTYVEH